MNARTHVATALSLLRQALRGWLAVLICFAWLPQTEAATRIRLATLAPTGSVYHKNLLTLRDQWRTLSKGQVDLLVYPDGKLGGEAEVVRLMGLNSIQAAMVTVVGLSEIEPSAEGLQSIPMGFRNLDEVDFVGAKLHPMLEAKFEARGYVVLGWSDAGWVRFFTTRPVRTPDDLKPLKLFTWAGNPDVVSIYRSAGFTAVGLETADIVPSLETGLIEAVPCPPVFALKTQIDRRASYMVEVNWAPLVGGIIINKSTWDSLPADLHAPLLQAARTATDAIREAGRVESEESVKAMVGRGLKVTRLTPDMEQTWRTVAETTYPQIRGKIVPADMFDRTLGLLQEYRATHP